MIRFLQTDYDLVAPVRAGGCAMLSTLWLAKRDYSIAETNDFYKNCVQVGFLDTACTILSWKDVVWSAGAEMHFLKKVSSFDYACAPNEREILKWYLSNVKENHFTIGDGKSVTVFDSMARPDIMAKYATFVEKVIVSV